MVPRLSIRPANDGSGLDEKTPTNARRFVLSEVDPETGAPTDNDTVLTELDLMAIVPAVRDFGARTLADRIDRLARPLLARADGRDLHDSGVRAGKWRS